MALFGKQKPLPLAGLLNEEQEEFNNVSAGLNLSQKIAGLDAMAASAVLREEVGGWLNEHPNKAAWAYFILANLHLTAGDLTEAASVFKRGTIQFPKDPRAHFSLGTIYLGLAQVGSMPQADVGEGGTPEAQGLPHTNEHIQLLAKAFKDSTLVSTAQEASTLAMNHFQKTMECPLTDEDKKAVLGRIQQLRSMASLQQGGE